MLLRKAFGCALLAGVVLSAGLTAGAIADEVFSKDVEPSGRACDALSKGSAAWADCVGPSSIAMSADELFYAGYWFAKSGRYSKALTYLERADQTDPRVLTYIGFATRKLGDVDAAFGFYADALKRDPQHVVARAYMGEAYLAKDQLASAEGELRKIASVCGETCAPYIDLSRHIADYRGRFGSNG